MKWNVKFYSEFDKEFEELNMKVQDELLSYALLLEKFGPQLGRPGGYPQRIEAFKYERASL